MRKLANLSLGCFVLAILGFVYASATPAFAQGKKKAELKVKVGDTAPKFESVDENGKTFRSTDVVGKKIVVLYFYPADFTGGCTKQACGFRDNLSKLAEAGVEVVGVSGDSVKNHQLFKKKENLNFALLADESGEVSDKFGVPFTREEKSVKATIDGKEETLVRKGTSKRWTFIVKDGKIAYKNTEVKAAEDPQTVLEAVKALK
jgi:peroxiredoxin Q/BCP